MSTQAPSAPRATRKPRMANVSPFTRSEAERICRRYDADENLTQEKLAKEYGVRAITIGRVLRGEIKNFKPEPKE